MLSNLEFQDWCQRNQISKEAKTVIERIRSSEPSRRVRSGNQSVSGTFPSRKMEVTIQYESHKNELPFIHELEHDSDVLEYYDQPCQIKLSYLSKKGRRTAVLHTPDFFVIKQDEAVFVECKTEDELLNLSVKNPNRFKFGKSEKWVCPPGKEYANTLGLDYSIRSDKEICWVFQRNIEFLDDYYRTGTSSVRKQEYAEILEIVRSQPAVSLQRLFEQVGQSNPSLRDDIYNLIAADLIYTDLRSQLLTEPHNVLLFSDREVATAHSNIVWTANQTKRGISKFSPLHLAPNEEVLWDGKAWKIINVGESELTLSNQDGNFLEIALSGFEKLVTNGKIQPLSGGREKGQSVDLKILLEAGPGALAEANKRLKWVLSYISNGESEETIPFSERTVKRWLSRYRASEAICGRGYYGLIPKPNNGNVSLKIDEENKKLLEDCITGDFESLTGRNRKTVHRAYKAECEKRGIIAASYVTFCKYVKKRPKDLQTLKRAGKRAAYAHEKFYWRLEPDTSRHEERPFHIAHVDHTQLDVELLDSVTGKELGRPWLTFLIDAFTRRILAFYLTFDKPSKISCMMVLRECVRRHGRLPQILVVDGGKDFSSTYFESLLAVYEVTKKTRPPAKARFGSVIERLFRTNDTQFIHNLKGNTKITKNVRQVTKSNNPKNLAVWDIGGLFDRLSDWAYTVYDQAEHSSLGQSPQEAFAQGILNSGARSHVYIPYDESFRMLTLPGPLKGTAKINYVKGVKINTIFYWSNEFRTVGIAGKNIPVKYDPFDIGRAYAFVNGRWCECFSEHYSVLKGRSEREVYLASKELKRRLNVRSLTTSKLAEFISSIDDDETILQQRILDREQRPIRQYISGDISSNSNSERDEGHQSVKTENAQSKNVIQFPMPESGGIDEGEDVSFAGYPVI